MFESNIYRFDSFLVSENVGRLKKLEYLNLALNNVTKVENLEGKQACKLAHSLLICTHVNTH